MSQLIYRNAECRNVRCGYAECHYAECHYAECRYAECSYAECRYAECRYAECRGEILSLYNVADYNRRQQRLDRVPSNIVPLLSGALYNLSEIKKSISVSLNSDVSVDISRKGPYCKTFYSRNSIHTVIS